MPIFEYKCNNCGHVFEKIVFTTIVDKHKNTLNCPKCNAANSKKLISKSSFKLIGSGFYANDYGSSSISKDVENIDN